MKLNKLTCIAIGLAFFATVCGGAETSNGGGKKIMNIQKLHSGIIDKPTYHGWPTVIRTKDNKLIAVCSGNRQKHVCPFGRVWMYVSEDNGKTWQGPKKLSSGPLDDRDAGICQAADGSLLVNYFTSTAAIFRAKRLSKEWKEVAEKINLTTLRKEHGFWMRRSTDGGKSWSTKYRTPVYSPHGPVLLKDGRLFFPGQRQGSLCAELTGKPEYHAAFSNDHGQTWQIASEIPLPAGQDIRNIHEIHGVEAPDGTLVVQYRNHNCSGLGETWQSESTDGGRTWSAPHFICKGFPTHLHKFGKDKMIMSYTYRLKPYGIRARISEDSGKSWSSEIILSDDGKVWDLGYPSTVEMADGTLFTLWYERLGKGGAKLRYLNWKFND
ncbi:MAG: exo-alpha-sialidase [Lentisphaeria bacterium]|nr:exo-alpha-sialidase [Lentisphaeria bacterium]